MSGTTFISRGEETNYGVGSKSSPAENSDEHEVYLSIIGLINDAIRDGTGHSFQRFGDVAGAYLNRRFLGGEYTIIPEHSEITGFPDLAIERDDIVICLDHFSIDASEPIVRDNRIHGSSYKRFLSQQDSETISNVILLERRLIDSGIVFSKEHLTRRLYERLTEKTEKAPRYVSAVKEHILATEGDQAENLRKPYEVWLLIVDNTPPPVFPFADSRIIDFFCSQEKIAGAIYLHNPYPEFRAEIINDLAFIRNDDTARKQLEKLGG